MSKKPETVAALRRREKLEAKDAMELANAAKVTRPVLTPDQEAEMKRRSDLLAVMLAQGIESVAVSWSCGLLSPPVPPREVF